MVSSLGCACRSYGGPQTAPATPSGSFLTADAPSVPLASADLGTLLSYWQWPHTDMARILRAQRTPGYEPGRWDMRRILLERRLPGYTPPPLPRRIPWRSAYQMPPGAIPAIPGGGAIMRAPQFMGDVSAAALPRFNIQHISDGTFTEKTVENMHKAVLAAKTDAKWRGMVEDIRRAGRDAGAIGWKDWLGEVRWFDHWLRKVHPIDYVRDPAQVELVMHPFLTYHKKMGDCDDSSVLWTGMLGTIGAPHRFRTYKADPRRPDEYSHVVGQVFVPNAGWVNNDLTLKDAKPGFEPTGFPSRDWPEPRWM
ncbi:MAG: transglutaminase domain-containing protein [Egibacteraceae bacterium]